MPCPTSNSAVDEEQRVKGEQWCIVLNRRSQAYGCPPGGPYGLQLAQ
jgi:hypothetical protein